MDSSQQLTGTTVDNQNIKFNPLADSNQRPTMQLSRTPSRDELHDMRILIVDDMPTNIILFSAILEYAGFSNIVTTYDANKALSRLENYTVDDHCDIDLVLLDIIMPGKDGHSVCRAMRKHPVWQRIPVIMTTPEKKWREETARACFDSGATDVMFTPIDSVELIPRIISALGQKWERDTRLKYEQQLEATLKEYRIAEARLKYLVTHDDVTGLYNRRHLDEALELATIYTRNYNQVSALLFIDIDNFKSVVDNEGHLSADKFLIDVATLIRNHVDPSHLLARISGDEFALLMENIQEGEEVTVAHQVLEACSSYVFRSNKHDYPLSVSIGITPMNRHTHCPGTEILSHADYSCQLAKQHATDKLHVFSENDEYTISREQERFWKPLLQESLSGNCFELLYQPVISGIDSTVHHFEVLLRLNDKDGKLLQPSTFIPVAERIGLIGEIDRYVTHKAISALSSQDKTHTISINISGETLRNHEFILHIDNLLEKTGIQGRQLVFEISEHAAIQKLELIRLHMLRLREYGCRFTLDNFGSGSNFKHILERLPLDFLKIDGRLITNMPNDQANQTLVTTMVEVAHSSGMRTIAGHVDRPELVSILRNAHIDFMQGHHLGHPDKSTSNKVPEILS